MSGKLSVATLALSLGLLLGAAGPEPAAAACPPVPQPESMTNPAFYDFVHSYNGACASRANWDRSFDDVTISTKTAAGATIQVTTSTALGGAVASLEVSGREFIASGGHGSALQWAYHAWHAGASASECYNPTQAGSRLDDAGQPPPFHGASTSALYVHERRGSSAVATESRPAMFIEHADPNPRFGGCHAADVQPDRVPFTFGLSPYWLKTSVALAPDHGLAGLDNVIRMTAELSSEDDLYPNFDGLLVAYLQRRFSDAFTIDLTSGSLQPRQPSDPGVGQPVMRCTQDRAECLRPRATWAPRREGPSLRGLPRHRQREPDRRRDPQDRLAIRTSDEARSTRCAAATAIGTAGPAGPLSRGARTHAARRSRA